MQKYHVNIIGAGLAGSEAALQLAARGIKVTLIESRPLFTNGVHETGLCAELVCSNSLKSENPSSAAGMLKHELDVLGSFLYQTARETRVPAGGALAVDRYAFAHAVTDQVTAAPGINLVYGEALSVHADGSISLRVDKNGREEKTPKADAVIVATGPLTSDSFADFITGVTGQDNLSFFDAAAPIVMADSLDTSILFRQSRYEEGQGDYLNAPFTKEEYEQFITALLSAKRVVRRDFETKELFQACQPIEEIARAGVDAPRFGPLKPVGLIDPRTHKRPWAALQLRAENREGTCYNLVGFQTNLTFLEQRRVFQMIPGLEQAEFARYGVMHRNTFIDAPQLLANDLSFKTERWQGVPLFAAGQITGTEGYCEAIRSGLHAAFGVVSRLRNLTLPPLSRQMAFGSLWLWASNPATESYQPMHVNFGIIEPLAERVKNKRARYDAYAQRGGKALDDYCHMLSKAGLLTDAYSDTCVAQSASASQDDVNLHTEASTDLDSYGQAPKASSHQGVVR